MRREVPSKARRKGQACVHRSEYLNLATFARILTAPVGRVWRLTHFYSVALLLEKRFACHHSTPYFFISLFPTAFYDRSRMTGRYLIPFRKKRFFCVCSYLPLPSAPLDTLAKAKRLTHFYSVALLLEKWFACFPTSGDGLCLVFFLFDLEQQE